MRAADLITNIDTLKKIEKLEADLEKLVEGKQAEIDQLKKSLPADLKKMLDGDEEETDTTKRIRLNENQKSALSIAAQNALKGNADGLKFGELKEKVKKFKPDFKFNDSHLRAVLKSYSSVFKMKGAKINATWHLK